MNKDQTNKILIKLLADRKMAGLPGIGSGWWYRVQEMVGYYASR